MNKWTPTKLIFAAKLSWKNVFEPCKLYYQQLDLTLLVHILVAILEIWNFHERSYLAIIHNL